MAIKLGKYTVDIKDADGKVLDQLPDELPVIDFDGNTVTLSEARSGFMRHDDYTRKTTEVAEVRKLLNDLGITDHRKGADILRGGLATLAELEELGVLNSRDGSIVHEALRQAASSSDDDDDLVTTSRRKTSEQLREEQALQNRLQSLERGLGSVLAVMTRRDLRAAYPDMDEDMLDFIEAQHRDNPRYTPMEYAKALEEKLRKRDQAAIDRYEEQKQKEKEDALTREPGKPGVDLFTEDVTFSMMPERHEGKSVMTPAQAASKYLEGALAREE